MRLILKKVWCRITHYRNYWEPAPYQTDYLARCTKCDLFWWPLHRKEATK